MKANRHYTNQESLKIMDTVIDSRACAKMQVTFTVDARHILLAITSLREEEQATATRKQVEDQLRQELYYCGERYYLSPIDYNEEGEHYNLRENLEKVLPIGKRLFPEFFNLPNSVDFIRS